MRHTSLRVAITFFVSGVVSAGAMSFAAIDEIEFPTGQPKAAPLVAEKIDAAVAKLIKDLGDDDYRTREKAGRDLAAMGDKALPQMRAALRETDNPEVQRRLAVMIRRMDTERLVSPRRVTLAKKEMTAKAAFDEIAKQTGYRIDYSGGGGDVENTKQSFEFDNVPFWVAIDTIANLTGSYVQVEEYGDFAIRVYTQDALNPHVAYAGPFRFLATNINSNDSIQLSGISRRGGTYRHSNMNFSFQIQSEPKNPMLGVTQAEIISAVDENGSSLVMPRHPHERSHYYHNPGSFRGHNTYGNLNLTRADKGATKIKALKAKIGIVLLSGTSPEIVIADPLKAAKKSYVGRTMELDFGSLVEDQNNKGQYTLDITARKLGENDPNRPDYNWSNTVWQKIELLDAAGNVYRTYGPNNSNNNGNVVSMTIPYGNVDRRGTGTAKLGPPVKMVINEWLSVTHEVTFEFKDLPLP
jgi:hypothetical protein